MKKLKPVVLTKRQIENFLEKMLDVPAACLAMSGPVYDYAWTVWASRRDIEALQGKRALRQSKRERIITP